MGPGEDNHLRMTALTIRRLGGVEDVDARLWTRHSKEPNLSPFTCWKSRPRHQGV